MRASVYSSGGCGRVEGWLIGWPVFVSFVPSGPFILN